MELFVSDLDGTLLNSHQELSHKTLTVINNLIKDGLNFSIATARSVDSAAYIIEALDLRLPIIVHNGVFIYHPVSRENIVSWLMDAEDACQVLELYKEYGISPFVYTITDKGEKKAYYKEITHPGEELYLNDRLKRGDKRFFRVDDLRACPEEKIIAILSIGEGRVLDPLSREVREKFSLNVHHAVDLYSQATWLEINHKNANKKEAVKKLKELLQAEKVICFGDHLNDIPMFQIADEKYAVSNAQDALKEMATGIIESNDEDGVALYLKALKEDIF